MSDAAEIVAIRGEIATLGGGCFWCLEAVLEQLAGVERIESGYSGGSVAEPSYAAVCAGGTGHAEVVQLAFDPERISFRELLLVFFSVHDPTTLNRQGADMGSQYRSVIFYHSLEQRAMAQDVIRDVGEMGIWQRPIVTEVTAFDRFYKAEKTHQEYYRNNRGQPYCRVVIAPKVARFRAENLARLKSSFGGPTSPAMLS